MECKKALEEAGGDLAAAEKILAGKFGGMAARKAAREARDGVIDVYLHPNAKIGVILELNSETDFVARNPAFKDLAHDIALHIAAMNPRYRATEDITADVKARERKDIEAEVAKMGESGVLAKNNVAEKLSLRLQEISLMSQPFIKDQNKKISDLIEEAIGKFGENIKIGRFTRYSI